MSRCGGKASVLGIGLNSVLTSSVIPADAGIQPRAAEKERLDPGLCRGNAGVEDLGATGLFMGRGEEETAEDRLRRQIEAYHVSALAYAAVKLGLPDRMGTREIGRASCRERV